MNMTETNHLPRKQLSEQLDRLDTILDGLSDALNEAVADAAREGAQVAVREILSELLVNQDAIQLLRQQLLPAELLEPQPSLWQRFKRGAVDIAGKIYAKAKQLLTPAVGAAITVGCIGLETITSVVNRVKRLSQKSIQYFNLLKMLGNIKYTLGIAASIGVVLAVVSWCCPDWLSTLITSVLGTLTAIWVQASLKMYRFWSAMQLS
ncbi:MAG: hypothetical protein R3B84_10010 [Zavarzinella sp.]